MKVSKSYMALAVFLSLSLFCSHRSVSEVKGPRVDMGQEKLILTYYFADWCPPCRTFEWDMAHDAQVAGLISQVELEKINGGESLQGEGRKTPGSYTFPTFKITDTLGKPLNYWSGYGKANFIKKVSDAIANRKAISQTLVDQLAEPTVERAVFLAEYFGALSDFDQALAFYDQASQIANEPCKYLKEMFDVAEIRYLTVSRSPGPFGLEEIANRSLACTDVAGDALLPALSKRMAETALSVGDQEKYQEWLSIGLQITKDSKVPEAKALAEYFEEALKKN